MGAFFGPSLEKHKQTHLPYVVGVFDTHCRHCRTISAERARAASERALNLQRHAAHVEQGFSTDPNCAVCKEKVSDARSRARSDAENYLRRDDEG